MKIRKITVLTILTVFLSACASITPATSGTEMKQDRIKTEAVQDPASESDNRTRGTAVSTRTGDWKMTILYDNTVFDPRLRADHGFAVLIDYNGHRFLFDTGARGDILLYNMREMGVEPRDIEAIVLSHAHGDHIGGLQMLLEKVNRPAVYVSSAFPGAFKKSVSDRTKLVETEDALAVFPGVYMTRAVGSIVEQALVMDTPDGSVVITGCAHPGIVRMACEAQKVVPGEISLLIGGFHLIHANKSQLQNIIHELRHLGVRRVLPAHCTGEEGIALFKIEYGKNCIGGGVGRMVSSFQTGF